jgi:hypothetical protein
MLCRSVRVGIYRFSRRACASAGPSAHLSRRAGAECRTGCRSGREYGALQRLGKESEREEAQQEPLACSGIYR